MKFEITDKAPAPPRRATGEQADYDAAVGGLKDGLAAAIAITVEPEQDPKSIKTRLTRAATRAGVKVRSWYDADTAKVYAELRK